MRRHLLTLALAGVLGAVLAADAQACHKKKCAAPCPAPAPCVVVEPCPPPPCPPPAPVCEPCPPPAKKCCLFGHKGGGHKLGGLFHHKKAACAPAPVCEAPVVYAAPAPVWAPAPSPQIHASGQGM